MSIYRRDIDMGTIDPTSVGYALRSLLSALDNALLELAMVPETPDTATLDDELNALRKLLIGALREARAAAETD